MREAELQALVVELAETRGVFGYHTYDSRRSVAGFPDLVLIGARGVLYRELKTATGRVSPEQTYVLEALRAAGEDADVWRPADWPHRIDAEISALGRIIVPRPQPSQAAVRRRINGRSGALAAGPAPADLQQQVRDYLAGRGPMPEVVQPRRGQ